jgi:hypothetical protein
MGGGKGIGGGAGAFFLKKLNLSWYYQLGLRGPLILIE